MKPRFFTLNIILLVLLSSTGILKAQVFVKYNATGANNGSSWANAYTNLDSAIRKTAAGEIWVAAGTYKPSVPFLDKPFPAFNITRNIALYGGFKGNESSLGQRSIKNNLTILSGDIGVAGNDEDNSATVLAITGNLVDSNCIVDGFTITKAFYSSKAGSSQNAAVHNLTENNNPVVRNCTIKNNTGFYGAGIYIANARPLIYNNLITGNTAFEGAGICLDYASDARIISNRIIGNKCAGGYSHLNGGGIAVKSYCTPYIYGNLIDNNYAGNAGGGISLESNYSAVIANNIISNNSSLNGGGVFVDFTVTDFLNNLVVGNKANKGGGGIYVNNSTSGRSVNNTIVGNATDGYGGGVFLISSKLQFVNTIIYSNPTTNGKQFSCNNGSFSSLIPTMDYCVLEEGKLGISFNSQFPADSIWRTGNIESYPLFADSANANYRLLPGSAAINAGIPDAAALMLPATDISGTNRVAGGRIDMGCYEYDNQLINTDSLLVSPNLINLEGRADSTFNITVGSNVPWFIISKPDWVKITDTTGVKSAVVKVTAVANPSLNVARSGTIDFSREGIAPVVQVKVNQTGSAYILVKPDTVYIGGRQNDTAGLDIFSNIAWEIKTYSNWFSFDKMFAMKNARVLAKATANKSGSNRILNVVLSSSDFYMNPPVTKQFVMVQQPGYYKLCQNESDSISAGANSGYYRWEVDTGSGFIDFVDGGHYSGADSKWLKLNNIPSSYNGYKYRCWLGYAYSDVYAVKIENTWIATGDQPWENKFAWSCGVLPDANTDVVIKSGNISVNQNTTIRSLSLSSGATLTVAPGVQFTVLK